MKNKVLNLFVGMGLLLSVLAMPAKAEVGVAVGFKGYTSTFDTTGSEIEGTDVENNPDGADEENTGSATNDADFGSGFIEYTSHEEGSLAGVTFGLEFIPGTHSLGTKSRTDSSSTVSSRSSKVVVLRILGCERLSLNLHDKPKSIK